MPSQKAGKSREDVVVPFAIDQSLHFQTQAIPLYPWEIMLSEHERDHLDVAFESAFSEGSRIEMESGVQRLKFQLVPICPKEIYGNRRELIVPIKSSTRISGANSFMKKGRIMTSVGPSLPNVPVEKVKKKSGVKLVVDSGVDHTSVIHGWKSDALRLIDDLKSQFETSWTSVVDGPAKLPFYNDIIGHVALGYALVEMKINTTKDNVKETSKKEYGYKHCSRFLSDMRTLFAQHFKYIQRVSLKDNSISIPIINQPTSDTNKGLREYPTVQELDLLEVDLTSMVTKFEQQVASTPSFSAYCLFEGEPPEKRVATIHHSSVDDGVETIAQPRGNQAVVSSSNKRPFPGVIDAPSTQAPKKMNSGIGSPKGRIHVDESDDAMDGVSTMWGGDWGRGIPLGSIDTDGSAVTDNRSNAGYGLKENAGVPVEAPTGSALSLPDLPTLTNVAPIPSGQLDKFKKKASQIFQELDIMYRFAILSYLSFHLSRVPAYIMNYSLLIIFFDPFFDIFFFFFYFFYFFYFFISFFFISFFFFW
eukprot:GHVH01012115.1.p1 GENE.GHVH01012115.1~~GHVH01012115.1.p1  ORF type:complete len:533 (-),score=83.98 GHVH01012115.1:1450-3048(-)